MTLSHSKYRRFLIILFELFIILKAFQVWQKTTGLSIGSFLILMFVLFWIINFILVKMEFARDPQDILIYKIMPRMRFSSDWFGIGVAGSIIIGFFFSTVIQSKFLLIIILILLGFFAYQLIFRSKNLLRYSWGLVLMGFMFGLAMGSKYSDNALLIIIFLLGYFFMYISSPPGEI